MSPCCWLLICFNHGSNNHSYIGFPRGDGFGQKESNLDVGLAIDVALDFLRKAYEIKKDPEISAHLGEVLWHANKIDEAQKIWDESLQQYPDNKILLKTVKKYR